jgi:hypothetical protein
MFFLYIPLFAVARTFVDISVPVCCIQFFFGIHRNSSISIAIEYSSSPEELAHDHIFRLSIFSLQFQEVKYFLKNQNGQFPKKSVLFVDMQLKKFSSSVFAGITFFIRNRHIQKMNLD